MAEPPRPSALSVVPGPEPPLPSPETRRVALELLLEGLTDEAKLREVNRAFYRFARGDPDGFAVQFAVLLQAHCLALKAGPQRIHQALAAETQRLGALLMAYQTALEDAAAAVTRQAGASAAQNEALGQRLEALERLVLTVQQQEHAARRHQDEAVRNACAAALSAAEGLHHGRRLNLFGSVGLVIALTALATTLFLHWLWAIH